MTRKDYVAIAEAIRATLDEVPTCEGMRIMAGKIADVMQADNCRFDRQRFLADCGMK